jgi:hypothetical protein
MANPTLALIIGVLEFGSLSPVNETLSLEAVVSKVRGESVVIARLRNRGEKPCVVVIDDYFCQIETQLYDGEGALLPAWDRRATMGVREMPEKAEIATLKPGEAVEIMHFQCVRDYATAMASHLHWDLQDVAGQVLKVGFTYSLSEEMRAVALTRGAEGAVFGQWASPKVEFPTAPLTQAQVNNVLSTQRVIKNAQTIPMLTEALVDGPNEVRATAAISLGELKATTAAGSLAERLLKDPDRGVRRSAARALGEIADSETRRALETAAREDDDEFVRRDCKEALEKFPR